MSCQPGSSNTASSKAEAAEILIVSRLRVSDVLNKKAAKFTTDSLIELLSRVGKQVNVAVN